MHLVDIHAHILPGLDDGPKGLAEALLMCRLCAAQGVRTVVATPHLCDPRFDVKAEAVRRAVRELSNACRERGIDLEILPGGEVRLTPELLEALDTGRALTLADAGRHLLLELPLQVVPRIGGLIFDLAMRGISPVLTHPECNFEAGRKPGRLAELVERGCLVQVSAASLLGEFGPLAKRAARAFLEAGFVHVVASDAHSVCGSRSPALAQAAELVVSILGEDGARELVCTNPGKIARGEPVGPHPSGAFAPFAPADRAHRDQAHKAQR